MLRIYLICATVLFANILNHGANDDEDDGDVDDDDDDDDDHGNLLSYN